MDIPDYLYVDMGFSPIVALKSNLRFREPNNWIVNTPGLNKRKDTPFRLDCLDFYISTSQEEAQSKFIMKLEVESTSKFFCTSVTNGKDFIYSLRV